MEASYGEYLNYKSEPVSSEASLFRPDKIVTVPYYNRLRQLMVNYFPLYQGSSLLDGGCGLGRLTYDAGVLGHFVVGVDISRPFIQFCKKLSGTDSPLEVEISKVGQYSRKAFLTVPDRYKYVSCEFVIGDLLGLAFSDKSFSYVVSSSVLDRVRNPHQAVQEIHRILCKKGRAIVTSPLDWRMEFTPQVEWWIKSLLELFSPNKWNILLHEDQLEYCLRISDRYLEHYLCEVVVVEKL
ncbi:methyltransferase domain-containing protein [bacterium]|nr:methyltransferase domain-containing protein [bacterium]